MHLAELCYGGLNAGHRKKHLFLIRLYQREPLDYLQLTAVSRIIAPKIIER